MLHAKRRCYVSRSAEPISSRTNGSARVSAYFGEFPVGRLVLRGKFKAIREPRPTKSRLKTGRTNDLSKPNRGRAEFFALPTQIVVHLLRAC